MSRTTDRDLYWKLYNHNAFTKYPLDVDGLGAGGSKKHLIFLGTQNKLGHLMTNSELWDLINSIGDFEYQTKQQLETPLIVWYNESHRLDNLKEKINYQFADTQARATIKSPIGEREN